MSKLCELFGHKVSQAALLICDIKATWCSSDKPNIMECERCGWTINLNNSDEVTEYRSKPKLGFFKTLWNMVIRKGDQNV